MDLHLFCNPGERNSHDVVEACRPYLAGKLEPVVAYLPQAALNVHNWFDYTVRSFEKLAHVELIDTEKMALPEMEASLRRAHVVYIPGGNTFLLNHRLQVSRLQAYLKRKIQAGLPLVAFSAGTVLCGPNILTSNDLNAVETPYFAGLNLVPFNFNVHYDDSAARDDWLSDYHVFQENPVLLMAEDAYIRVSGKHTRLERGAAWILRNGQEKEKLAVGQNISLQVQK
jgi:dipeptidase E